MAAINPGTTADPNEAAPEVKYDFYFDPAQVPKTRPIERAMPKAGRNDPCPCGSGKKYKKCCYGKDVPWK